VIQEVLSLGAMGYVVKAQVGSDLLEAVEAVILGKAFVSAMVNYNVSPRLKLQSCAGVWHALNTPSRG
jgi:DNA-binding NarL/FixJ family response regulator